MRIHLIIFMSMLLTLPALAQQQAVTVVDMETHLPIVKATVRADSDQVAITDQHGRALLDLPCRVLRFSHLRYHSEELTYEELTDTMYLLPLERTLDEVVVTGITPERLRIMQERRNAYLDAPAIGVGIGSMEFDLAKMLDRRTRRDRKHLRQARKILREWDEKPSPKAYSPEETPPNGR